MSEWVSKLMSWWTWIELSESISKWVNELLELSWMKQWNWVWLNGWFEKY